jgi:CRP-like cAMP-binding protein
MYALLSRMSERKYAPGEEIIVQGEKGDFYYIIKTGRVAVLKRGKNDAEPKQVALLASGDGFGEEALIRDDPRNATCRAMEETTVYALDKVDFSQILKASFLENVFSEEINMDTYRAKYVVIDARIPPEYEEEHIEGAVNIPVEVLRQKYVESTQRRSISRTAPTTPAAWCRVLLKNHGLKPAPARRRERLDRPTVTGNDGSIFRALRGPGQLSARYIRHAGIKIPSLNP